jgi:hypothetical protein
MMVMGGDRPLSEPLEVMTRVSKDAKSLKFRTCGRLYPEDTILEWLSQDLQDMAAELRQFIQEEHPVVREQHLARHRRARPRRGQEEHVMVTTPTSHLVLAIL